MAFPMPPPPPDKRPMGVRLDGAGAAVVGACTVPFLSMRLDDAGEAVLAGVCRNPLMGQLERDWKLLGRTPDGKLSYVCTGELRKTKRLSFVVETLDLEGIDDAYTVAGKWERRDEIVLDQFRVSERKGLKVRWFGERSGALLFTMGRRGGGAFVLNLATRSVEKLADGVKCDEWRNVFGYEMDHAALVASITARFTCPSA